ncbi:MAG: hypothetical protein KGQ86_03795 [Bacteroidetes bacterium]|nr:hypothetical protein [Bacteroidota bacterium]
MTFAQTKINQPVYQDKPYLQDFSIKYYTQSADGQIESAFTDRNGNIRVFSSNGLLIPHNGQFLYPGSFLPDKKYRTLGNKKIQVAFAHHDQFVLIDDKAVFSNAWAGSVYCLHELSNVTKGVGGKIFDYLITNGNDIHYVSDSKTWFKLTSKDNILDMKYHSGADLFWILTTNGLFKFNPKTREYLNLYEGKELTSFDIQGNSAVIGTPNGFFKVDLANGKASALQQKVPVPNITAVRVIGDRIWFGSTNGAFATRKDGKFDYFQGERWLPGNLVKSINPGPDNSVLIVTNAGLGQIGFKLMTLYEKAQFFQDQVRKRHIRNGFNASLVGMEKGNLNSGFLADSDNDGLWTSMYFGAEIFRYAVTKDADALENIRECLDAMERLYTINPVPGFPSRSFERRGFKEKLSDPERWQHAPDPEWDWKATTSSDEVIGHIFAFGALAELVPVPDLKSRAINLMDTLMMHIIKNDWYLIDYDGKPTLWGKWNPSYVNGFPVNVGDRKLNSSNIVAMLQTAYRFTNKPIYKEKAFELMNKHKYYENLMRPMALISMAPQNADDYAKYLSESWNHSDDEMYYMGYWGLYRYAFNDTLKTSFKKSIIDHFQVERPEKEGLWNIFTAVTGTPDFDLQEGIWYLKEHPLDLIDWAIANSHRSDIEKIAPNFRNQTIREVLPPDERPIQRHNANMFNLDRNGGNGVSEHSAGDIWLLPYWLGRFLGVISAPSK